MSNWIAALKGAGATVAMPKMGIPGMGRQAYI
jgi:predicted enzyme related to lactoylglutathione lyase